MSETPDPPADDDAPEPVRTRDAVVRRAPRFRRFVLAGIVLALLVGLVLWLVWELPVPPGESPSWFGLLWTEATAAAIGAVLGGVAAVVADARSARRSAP